MKKLTPVVAVAAAVLFTSGGSVAFAQTASSVSSYSPPMTEHKKKPKKPKKGASAPAANTNGQSQ